MDIITMSWAYFNTHLSEISLIKTSFVEGYLVPVGFSCSKIFLALQQMQPKVLTKDLR